MPRISLSHTMPPLLDLLLDELVATYNQIVEYPADLFQDFEYSAQWSGKTCTVQSIQAACWRVNYYGRGSLMKFLSFNKRFTNAINALSEYHNSILDQPTASRITAVLTECWLRKIQLYRKTRSLPEVAQEHELEAKAA